MGKYVLRRVLIALPVLVGISFLLYMLMLLAPGGPTAAFADNPNLTDEQKQKVIADWGLDKSPLEQYFNWFTSMLRGDWGTSFVDHQPVLGSILSRLPATILLMFTAYIIQQAIALPLGMWSALKRYSWSDKLFTILTYAGFSMPTFWLGLILIFTFAASLHWFPTGGITDGREPTFLKPEYWEWWTTAPIQALGSLVTHLALPVLTLVIIGIAADSRYMRSSMLETINQDYIRTARSKGLTEGQIVRRHALRPALLPVITNISLTLPTLIGGAVVTETIFSWPGMGNLFINAIQRADYPVMIGVVFILSGLILLFTIVADILYAVADPRIKY